MGLEQDWGQDCVSSSDSSQGAGMEPLAWPRALGTSGMLAGDCTVTSSLFTLVASIGRENNFAFSLNVL